MKKKSRNQDLLFISMLLFGIAVLFLNDRIWKYEYGTWFTGKLSDFMGLLILPIFISLIYPKTNKYISWVIGILFIFWKSPLSSPLIANWNSLQIFELTRVIDLTDYFALVQLPIAHFIATQYDLNRIRERILKTVHKLVLAPTILILGLIFCSTSVAEPAYPKGDILIEESYDINGKTETQILSYLNSKNLRISTDSILYLKNNRTRTDSYYQIESLVVEDEFGTDTLKNINFKIYETKSGSSMYLINLSVLDDWDLQNLETLKWKRKRYMQIIEKQIIKRINSI